MVFCDINNLQLDHAKWIRADFHLHTRADKEFKYSGEENSFVAAYVDALEQAGIRLGVITNHNKFDFNEFKALRKAARKKNIALLPGVELSVNDGANGIHTLVVFSDEWITGGHDYINQFLNVAFQGKVPAQYEQENGRSSLSLIETIKKLESYDKDFFLVFAHVEDPSGLWKELDGGRIQELGANESFRKYTLGFQKVKTYNKQEAGIVDQYKVKQWLKDWYPAEVQGSDPKKIEEIGRGKHSYIKLGELSFPALKFALSLPHSRVAAEPEKHQGSYITSVKFEGGILSGKEISFSPELNTLIGIRGSGKSSILEAIRYALNIPWGDKAQDTKYKEGLIKHLLGSGGKVTLTAKDIYGQDFQISRILGESPNVYVQGKLQPGISIKETIIRQPIYFGQKDLSSTGEGFEADLVEKLTGEKLFSIRAAIQEQIAVVESAAKRWVDYSNTAEQKQEYKQQLLDANFRLERFEQLGVAEKLQKRLSFQQDANALAALQEKAENFAISLTSVLAEHEDSLRNAKSHVSKENAEFFNECFQLFDKLINKLDALKTIESEAHSVSASLKTKQESFGQLRNSLQEEFAQIERQLATELKENDGVTIQASDFLTLQQKKSMAEQMLAVLEKQDSQKDTLYNSLLVELDKLNQLWLQEFQAIKQELDKVNQGSNSLQIEASFKANKEAAVQFIQQLFRGSNLRESTFIKLLEEKQDFAELLRDLPQALEQLAGSKEVFTRYFMENLSTLLVWQVPNVFSIKYRGKELSQHSLGQRASALLLYVLSQNQHDVVLIDQPEDDLDNQTIYEDVIKLLHEMKINTQFIFATHNANFPVLGDAEQVIACTYENDHISVNYGSVDAALIQNAIINIMEGGQEAFNRRKEVYRLWKP
ncbi:TrlF family AAA-like ATPase [Paenalcaligenes hermetiae]|uniref:Histidinol-phosphatase n=1 Tax=Paenalcaligenes hermetiae TaxID=1157987 RepID=A0ABP9M2B6_9BURK